MEKLETNKKEGNLHLALFLGSIAASLFFILFLVFSWPINDSKPNKLIKGVQDINVIAHPIKKNNSNPAIYAKAYYLVDLDSFYPMAEKNSQLKLPIASTTKIATAITVLENHSQNLKDVVTITPKMVAINGSDIKLQAGEKITVEKLLHGLLIMSGNDTAYALAEYFGGKAKFIGEMNKKVEEIGLKNTHYECPAGLDDDGYSTARDLAILASYALRNDLFNSIIKISEETIFSEDGTVAHELKASNRLIKPDDQYYYPYAFGVKTGFTYAAGHVLVSAAKKDGHSLLSVVLNTNENTIFASAKESKKLLEWGFDNWEW